MKNGLCVSQSYAFDVALETKTDRPRIVGDSRCQLFLWKWGALNRKNLCLFGLPAEPGSCCCQVHWWHSYLADDSRKPLSLTCRAMFCRQSDSSQWHITIFALIQNHLPGLQFGQRLEQH